MVGFLLLASRRLFGTSSRLHYNVAAGLGLALEGTDAALPGSISSTGRVLTTEQVGLPLHSCSIPEEKPDLSWQS